VAAAATLIAALVALFKEDFVKLWRRPSLSIRMLLAAPDCVQMPVEVRYRVSIPADMYVPATAMVWAWHWPLARTRPRWRIIRPWLSSLRR